MDFQVIVLRVDAKNSSIIQNSQFLLIDLNKKEKKLIGCFSEQFWHINFFNTEFC